MKTNLILTLLLLCIINAYADIKPNPIKAKGIIAGVNNSIRMDSERVVVDLYKDSSIVECHFYMKNDSAAQKLTIGFPEMNYHYLGNNNGTEIEKFSVYENGKKVKLINLHLPDTPVQKNQFGWVDITRVASQRNEDEPWFLWDSEFDKAEMKTIVVRYSLPCGFMKNGIRFFTYLLNTGSGWKGNIGKAEVVINLKDITPDLIIKALPKNHLIKGNQLSWTFTDFEPTTRDDIQVYYEHSKGYYKKISERNVDPVIVVNDKYIPNIDPLDMVEYEWNMERFAGFINLKADEIEDIKVLKDKQSVSEYVKTVKKLKSKKARSKYNTDNGLLIVYTKDYPKKKRNLK